MTYVTLDAFRSEMPPPRIIGSEMEYNVQLTRHYSTPQFALTLTEPLQSIGLGVIRQFTSNGARIYPDVGHTEYATPECLGPRQALHADIAGQDIMLALAATFEDEVQGVYRRVGYARPEQGEGSSKVDAKEFTTGYHENYLAPLGLVANRRKAQFIESYLATRNVWAGMGMVGLNSFYRSQKSMGIGHAIYHGSKNRTTEGQKPFGLYFSAHDDNNSSSFPRLEIRSSESNSSKWARFMGFAATSLVLRLIEQDDPSVDNDLIIKDTLEALHKVGRHTNLHTTTFETLSGGRINAIDHQEALATAAMRLCENVKLPDDEVYAAHEWLRVAQDLRKVRNKHDYPMIADRVEWAARYHILRAKYPSGRLAASNSRVRELDLKWDKLGDGGISDRWWRRQRTDPAIYDERLAKELRWSAPQQTRASIRADLILNRVREKGEESEKDSVDWGGASINKERTRFTDPYEHI
jgi:hypothetical protein